MAKNDRVSGRTYGAIFSVALLSFIGILTETATNVTYPELSRVFGISLDTTQWITAGYLLMVTIVMGTTSFLLKRVLIKHLHLIAVAAFMIGDVICAVAGNFPILLLGRFIQAAATGLSTPMMFQLIFTKIPREKLGSMTGIAAMVISFAPALGPTYGGLVATSMSWRMIFWLILPLAIVSLLLGQWLITNIELTETKPFSTTSFMLLASAMVVWIYALSMIGKTGFDGKFWLFLGLSLLLFAGFIKVNTTGPTELVDLGIFKHLAVALNGWNYFNLQFINIGISLVIPVYAQYTLHASAFISGLILLPGAICGAMISPFAGHLADRYGFKLPVLLGNTLFVIGGLLFWLGQDYLTPFWMMIFFIILRSGFNFAFSNTISNATVNVSANNAADVSSLFNMIQQFAGATGVVFLASLMAIFQNHGAGTMAMRTYAGGRLDFMMTVTLTFLTLLLSLINYHCQGRRSRQ
ncbi:MFS transporter [uncultured Limosilactobacillus sp.]|uniref:MFS transporter n=1 Tax=uncultured Limosilactobacillus sp. TaxID=2837629 RepID=UPI0025FD7F33|nr:MFS transporter [uncultured Limosilactobacillus sp.]